MTERVRSRPALEGGEAHDRTIDQAHKREAQLRCHNRLLGSADHSLLLGANLGQRAGDSEMVHPRVRGARTAWLVPFTRCRKTERASVESGRPVVYRQRDRHRIAVVVMVRALW